MITLHLVPEARVINEFLRNDFHQNKFERESRKCQHLIMAPEVTTDDENYLRRVLFFRWFRKSARIWRELPSDTQWWEVELEPQDVQKIRFFPRAEWRKVANGSFVLPEVVHSIRTGHFNAKTRQFINRVENLSSRFWLVRNSSILLIGLHDRSPLTIIDGNHRMAASLLASSPIPRDYLRYFCGLSPQMTQCCWYDTNLRALWRYARHRLRDSVYVRHADVERFLTELVPRDRGQRITQEATPEVE